MPRLSSPAIFIAHLWPLLLLLLPAAAHGQKFSPAIPLTPLPPGTTLPVRLQHPVRAGRTPPGTPIEARTTQPIPVSATTYLPRGLRLLGSVIASQAPSSLVPATLTLRFDRVRYGPRTLPLRSRAVAIASFTAVSDSFLPVSSSADRANSSPANWTTRQVGGDEVVRAGWFGEVINSTTQRVGFADFNGVYADPLPSTPGAPPSLPRAVSVFSTTAHGLYGYGTGARLNDGDASFTLTAPAQLGIHGNDVLLLQVR